MIVIKDLSCKNILKNINIKFPDGINYISGKNETAKSILLDCISNIDKNYTGSIEGNESVVYLNQSLYFSPKLFVKDFVYFVFSLQGVKKYKEEFFRHIEPYNLEKEFEENWKKAISTLSSGERSKLYFSVISFIKRDCYLFEEPFSGVDSSGRDCIIRIVNDLVQNGKSVIMTTQEAEPLQYFSKSNNIYIDDLLK